MCVGIFINVLSVIVGGILGALAGGLLKDDFTEKINLIFGCCSMGMGISLIVLMENMPVVVFAVIIGTALGLVLHLGELIERGGMAMQRFVCRFVKPKGGLSEEEFATNLVTIIVLFCASGTGIYGTIVAGMTGDNSILITKSILDLFTALIFACTLGMVVSLIALPQLVIFEILFYLATLVYPLTTEYMINDFKACGGFLLLATGFRIAKIKNFPIADMIPAMVLVWPMSFVWVEYVLPFLT